MQQKEIANVFSKVFHGRPNFMTPTVVRYGVKPPYLYELSKGEGIGGGTVYGVTVIGIHDHKHDIPKSRLFHSLTEANEYIENGIRRALSDRERVNKSREAGDKNPAVAVSDEFVEEMRDCVPPTTLQTGGLYSIIQVGEISEHDKDGHPLYETFQRMNEEAVRMNIIDSRMQVNQWYYVGLKLKAK